MQQDTFDNFIGQAARDLEAIWVANGGKGLSKEQQEDLQDALDLHFTTVMEDQEV